MFYFLSPTDLDVAAFLNMPAESDKGKQRATTQTVSDKTKRVQERRGQRSIAVEAKRKTADELKDKVRCSLRLLFPSPTPFGAPSPNRATPIIVVENTRKLNGATKKRL